MEMNDLLDNRDELRSSRGDTLNKRQKKAGSLAGKIPLKVDSKTTVYVKATASESHKQRTIERYKNHLENSHMQHSQLTRQGGKSRERV